MPTSSSTNHLFTGWIPSWLSLAGVKPQVSFSLSLAAVLFVRVCVPFEWCIVGVDRILLICKPFLQSNISIYEHARTLVWTRQAGRVGQTHHPTVIPHQPPLCTQLPPLKRHCLAYCNIKINISIQNKPILSKVTPLRTWWIYSLARKAGDYFCSRVRRGKIGWVRSSQGETQILFS